ncbi:MAG: hypothetical protein HYT12_04735 [Candidatus Liptonbacteria bacterium]|nr:hypothetical protein [Candidatus Liptonbacteria bacterium]
MEDLNALYLANLDLEKRPYADIDALRSRIKEVVALLHEVAAKESNIKLARQIQKRASSDAGLVIKKLNEVADTLNFLTATIGEFISNQKIKRSTKNTKTAP